MTDLLPLLQEFYREKLTMLLQHQAGARLIGQYDANNTYQYIINREEAQLTWVGTAIAELGGTVADAAEPAAPADGEGRRRGARDLRGGRARRPGASSTAGGRGSTR